MWILNVATGIFLLLLGVVIKFFNMSYLIAGYNTASKQEKQNYNEEKLVQYVSILLIVSSLVLIGGGLLSFLINEFKQQLFIGSWIGFTLVILVGLVYINMSGNVKKQ